jgi:hypothetical protein
MKDLSGRWLLYLRMKGTTMDGIGGWSSEQRSPLGSRGTLKKTLYEISRSKIAKQMLETSIRMWKMRNWTLWRGRPPPKRKNLLAMLALEEPEIWEHQPL